MKKPRKIPRTPLTMCEGPVIPQLLRFAVPLMLSGVLQLLYNAADLIVVGRFSENTTALASVGASTGLINLIVNVFMGLSIGANVVIARAIGAKDHDRASRSAHTAITVSVLLGVVAGVVTFLLAEQFLLWMGTPDALLGGATVYLRIYACGFPVSLLYNFGAAIMRACGDTRRPMYFLMLSGLVNVLLNLLFVTCFHMSSDGVALATVASQAFSAVLVSTSLTHVQGPCRIAFRRLRIHMRDLLEIMKIGIPASIQSACFSISNVIIQSSINTFGPDAIGGNTAASNLEGFIYTCFNAVAQSCLTFVGQNIGAGKIRRVPRIIRGALILSTSCWALLATICLVFAGPLLSLYTANEISIRFGIERMGYIVAVYFISAWMEVLSNSLRAMGVSVLPMVTCVLGVCGFRIVWIYTVFQAVHTPSALFLSYPITWGITTVVLGIALYIIYRSRVKNAPLLEET